MDAIDATGAEATTTVITEAPIKMVDESGDAFEAGETLNCDQMAEPIVAPGAQATNVLALTTPTTTPLSYTWRCIINLVLPFVNGMMLGFGEIFAHEVMFRWGWFGAKVYPPTRVQPRVGRSVLI